jgi:tripartite-type tricarboxylate transporter receptor subunit TctC
MSAGKLQENARVAPSLTTVRRRGVLASLLLAGAVALSVPFGAAARSYPDKPIRLIVPYPAGGTTDLLARALQQPLSDILGQPLIIDNRPGAGGEIGVVLATKSRPDGYTLVFANSGPTSILPLLRKVPYNTQTDLMPISMVVDMPLLLGVAPDSPVKNLQQFIAVAKEKGDRMFYGSIGVGSVAHLAGAALNDAVGTKLQHIAYNGGAQMTTGFAGGQVQSIFVTAVDGAPLLAGNRVRYIAVASPRRIPSMPNLGTIAEQVPGFAVGQATFGVMAPRGVPEPIISKLNQAIGTVLGQPAVRKFFEDKLIVVRPSSPKEYGDYIKAETAQFKKVIDKNKITLE